jgi:hypothetical protein
MEKYAYFTVVLMLHYKSEYNSSMQNMEYSKKQLYDQFSLQRVTDVVK